MSPLKQSVSMEIISPTLGELEIFLQTVDKSFPVALSAKRNLHELACKIHELGHCILAWEGGMLGGISWYDNDETVAYINILAVMPQFRRRGIARMLLRSAVERMPGNIKWVRVHTQTPGAYSLYTQEAFQPEARELTMEEVRLHGCFLRKPLHETIEDSP